MALFESGLLYLAQQHKSPIVVRRGMTIVSEDGQLAGQVAAVVADKPRQHVTHLLLSQPGQASKYRLVPVNLIEQLNDEIISLSVQQQVIKSLSLRQTS